MRQYVQNIIKLDATASHIVRHLSLHELAE